MLLTVAEVAARLRVHPRTVRRLIQDGSLAACRLGRTGRADRVYPDALADMLARRQVRAPCPSSAVPREPIKSPSLSAEERCANLLQLRDEWDRTRAACGLEHVRWHDLRHTCASWLVQAGVPLTTVRDLLGHSSIAVTQRYAHLAPQHLAEAIMRLA